LLALNEELLSKQPVPIPVVLCNIHTDALAPAALIGEVKGLPHRREIDLGSRYSQRRAMMRVLAFMLHTALTTCQVNG
jgi:aminoglycoside phosphotransferase (APT) family kinase protein